MKRARMNQSSLTIDLSSIADLHPAFCDNFTTTEDKHVLVMQLLTDETRDWLKQQARTSETKLMKVLIYVYRILGYRNAMAVPSALFLEKGLLTNVYTLIGFAHKKNISEQL